MANLYSYCVNNPVAWVDASGLNIQPALIGLRTAIGRRVNDGFWGFLSGTAGTVQTPSGEARLFEGRAYNQSRFQRAQNLGQEIARHDYYFRVEASVSLLGQGSVSPKLIIGYTWYMGLATRSMAEYLHIGAGLGWSVTKTNLGADLSTTFGIVFNPQSPVSFEGHYVYLEMYRLGLSDIGRFIDVSSKNWSNGATGLEFTIQMGSGVDMAKYAHFFVIRSEYQEQPYFRIYLRNQEELECDSLRR